MKMKRRALIQATALSCLSPLMPRLAGAASPKVLKFVPQADLATMDPIWTTAYVTRNHGYLVYDTLYGMDEHFKPVPQMVEREVVSDGGQTWTLTLRSGMTFHDGMPVQANDVVASITRWGKRDAFGKEVMTILTSLTAIDDKTVQFKLQKPFSLLPLALGKMTSNMPCIMPERLAKTDPNVQVTEIIGSGPFKLNKAAGRQGSLIVYEKFEGYVPSGSNVKDMTGVSKHATFDRVEWHILPDPATAVTALQSGEVDWVEQPQPDLLPLLKQQDGISVVLSDPSGSIGSLRLNQLTEPFNNPEIRRILLRAIDQREFMAAVVGTDPSMSHAGVGVFTPAGPMATDAGMSVLTGPRDYNKLKAELLAAGYKGEKVVLLAAADAADIRALCEVAAATMKRIGMNVDYQTMDWGMVQVRRQSSKPIADGGWSCLCTSISGLEALDPSSHQNTRGLGMKGQYGWPNSPKLEQYRADWFAAKDLAGQQAACVKIQEQVFIDVPYIPLGQYFVPVAFGPRIQSVLHGFAQFYNVVPGKGV